ncbi:MAG: cation diffusion facilitator family transporter [Alphaproteobacteria bacterium]|nr:cation diffusion facilitator family transporter [Alphaproteobacteria bacterium]
MMKIRMTNNILMKSASFLSIATALSLIIVKCVSFRMTNSLAILSSFMDSVLDLGASLVNFIAVYQALIPADKNHRFGHGKAEALGSLVQSIIIAVSGGCLLYEAYSHFVNPQVLTNFDVGFWVMCASIMMTLCLVWYQRYVIRKTNSLSIYADNAHYTGDILMNVGVIVSMFFSYVLEWVYVDVLFAVGVAFYLFFVSFKVLVAALEILMDAELPKKIRSDIRKAVLKHPKVKGLGDLRTRNTGSHQFVQFEVQLKSTLSLVETHTVCTELEKKIKKILPNAETFIHPEPFRHERSL